MSPNERVKLATTISNRTQGTLRSVVDDREDVVAAAAAVGSVPGAVRLGDGQADEGEDSGAYHGQLPRMSPASSAAKASTQENGAGGAAHEDDAGGRNQSDRPSRHTASATLATGTAERAPRREWGATRRVGTSSRDWSRGGAVGKENSRAAAYGRGQQRATANKRPLERVRDAVFQLVH